LASLKDAVEFLESDPKPEWGGNELVNMSKVAYCEMKIKEKGSVTGKAARNFGLRGKKGFNVFRFKDKRHDVFVDFMGARLKVNKEQGGRGQRCQGGRPIHGGSDPQVQRL
jgi:lupus La protein